MTTLYDAVFATYKELGTLKYGTVTAQGSDTDKIFKDANRPEPDEYFTAYESLVIVAKTTDGLAPQGEYQRLSAYDQDAADQITLASNVSAAFTVGDIYYITLPKYPVDMIVNAINIILGTLDFPHENTSLTTVAGQTEYTIPATIPKWGLRRVEIETDKTDTDAQGYEEIHNCKVFYGETGSTNTLVLPRMYAAGYTIKLIYVDSHPHVSAATDTISEFVPVRKLAAVVAPEVLRMKIEQYPSGDKTVGGRLSMMVDRATRMNLKAYIPTPALSGKLIIPRIGR